MWISWPKKVTPLFKHERDMYTFLLGMRVWEGSRNRAEEYTSKEDVCIVLSLSLSFIPQFFCIVPSISLSLLKLFISLHSHSLPLIVLTVCECNLIMFLRCFLIYFGSCHLWGRVVDYVFFLLCLLCEHV